MHQAGAQGIVQYTKGAPDEVLQLRAPGLKNRAAGWSMTDAEAQEDPGGQQGHGRPGPAGARRAACRIWDAVPADTSPANLERELTFLGLAGMIDPVRPEVKDAIAPVPRAPESAPL